MANHSDKFEFVLVGFPGLPEQYYMLVATTFFLVYVIAVSANCTVIALIILKEHLHQPMYVIIANLALSDILFDTLTLPKIIAKYWFRDEKMSFAGCLFQQFWIHHLGSLDSFVIMLMAIDRYVAICIPLRYSSLMTNRRVSIICCFFWLLSSVSPLIINILDLQLSFCGPNKVKSCFCVSTAVTVLACSNFLFVLQLSIYLAMVVLLLPLTFIIFSYIIIIKTALTSTSSDNWHKALYTCFTHLFVIGMFYVPRVFVYLANLFRLILNADLNVMLLCLYTFGPHMANPIVYCLRTKEIKQMLGNLIKKLCITKTNIKVY